MSYAKKNERQSNKNFDGIVWFCAILVILAVVTAFCLTSVRSVDSTKNSSIKAEIVSDVKEEDDLHITQFLGYEFGEVYQTSSQMLKEPWFGFLMVSLDAREPLRSMRFRKDTYEVIAKKEVKELAAAFEEKYGIKLSTVGDYDAVYYGKQTKITIMFFPRKGDTSKGTIRLEIEDVKLAKEWRVKSERDDERQKRLDIERM